MSALDESVAEAVCVGYIDSVESRFGDTVWAIVERREVWAVAEELSRDVVKFESCDEVLEFVGAVVMIWAQGIGLGDV